MPTKKPKPDLVKAADDFSRKYEDVFGDKDPQDIINELRGDGDVSGASMNSSGESAAREQWMLDAAEEIADAFIDDGLKEATATVSADIIARHYAAREREEWIPVSERLPEACEIVTMWNGQQRHQGYRSATDGDFHYCITGTVAERVTHWCRIPAVPFAAKAETESSAAQGEQHDH